MSIQMEHSGWYSGDGTQRSSSPYSTTWWELRFDEGELRSCFVPEGLLLPHKGLQSMIQSITEDEKELNWDLCVSQKIRFPEIDSSTRHTFLHYLFTGTYEILGEFSDEYTTSPCIGFTEVITVIDFAIEHRIQGLQDLAEIRLVECLDSLNVQSILLLASGIDSGVRFRLNPVIREWFSQRFVQKVAMDMDDSKCARSVVSRYLDGQSKGASLFYRIVLEHLIYALADQVNNPRLENKSGQSSQHDTPATISIISATSISCQGEEPETTQLSNYPTPLDYPRGESPDVPIPFLDHGNRFSNVQTPNFDSNRPTEDPITFDYQKVHNTAGLRYSQRKKH